MKKILYLLPLLLLFVLAGCKPTENNYRQAYETAQNARRQARQSDAELGIPELTATDGPRRQTVGTDSVYVRREALRLQGDAPKSGVQRANVAVGKYKMTANAIGDAEALRKAGYDSFVLATPNGEFYTVAASVPSLEEAVTILKNFMLKYPERPYVGLPGEPVIEVLLNSGI